MSFYHTLYKDWPKDICLIKKIFQNNPISIQVFNDNLNDLHHDLITLN